MKSNKETLKKFFIFGLVGGVGTIINTAILWALTSNGMFYIFASIIATEIAILSNFVGNHIFTFKGIRDNSSIFNKFGKFQVISLSTIIGTVAILWILTASFGQDLLLLWNLVAIVIMFVANFILNQKYTWKEVPLKVLMIGLLFLFLTISVSAERVSVSQFGYHPDSYKQAVVYSPTSSTVNLVDFGTNTIISSYILETPTDYSGSPVDCQGGNDCLIVDFSNADPGTYYLKTDSGTESPVFQISNNIYSSRLTLFEEFFNALNQQNSDYHEDMNSYNNLPTMADGSFILVNWQASESAIALGSAYRRNPEFFAETNIPRQIEIYVDYLRSIQGVEIQEDSDGFRYGSQGWDMKIQNVFVPGELNSSPYLIEDNGSYFLEVYDSGKNLIKNASVISLCDELSGAERQDCLNYASSFYKLQEHEPGINLTYSNKLGVLVSSGGLEVAEGWRYDWNCYVDVNPNQEYYNNEHNPCLIFDDETSIERTIKALVAYLESIPAIHDSGGGAEELLNHSVDTYDYIYSTGEEYSSSKNIGWLGIANFLLYDYTNNSKYLYEAYGLSADITKNLISDIHNPNSYYWEEYMLHKEDIENAGLSFNPSEVYTNKIYADYKDLGEKSIGNNGERVFEQFRDSGHQNSRNMIIEALFASKSMDYNPQSPDFVEVVAINQIAWITGMNAIQLGTSPGLDADNSISFIFGIGNFPEKFHSRYLIDTGYSSQTSGDVVGARGTGYMFHDGSGYVYFDGKTEILGSEFGSLGNGYNEEVKTSYFSDNTFLNGMDYIPGWINGAFDVTGSINPDEIDIFYNYDDDAKVYGFTESEAIAVSLMVELLAYQDGIYNNAPRHERILFNQDTNPPQEINATLIITSTPPSEIDIDGEPYGITPLIIDLLPGTYNITLSLENYSTNSTFVSLLPGEILNYQVLLSLLGNDTESNDTNDTTPPSIISGLSSTKGSDWIFWSWNNPSEEDFDENLIYLDGENVENTSRNNYNATGLEENTEYTIVIKTKDTSGNINDTPMTDITRTLEANSSEENETNLSATTNLSIFQSSENGADYLMYETETAYFHANSNKSVEWKVNGKLVITTLNNHDFTWNPGILYSGVNKLTYVEVSATSGGETIIWKIDVRDVINPFFSPSSGNGETTLHIFTYDIYSTYENVSVTITNPTFSSNTTFNLEQNNASNNETDWKKVLSFSQPYTHHMVKIKLDSTEHLIPVNSLGYYKTPPSTSNNNGGSRSTGGSSGENIQLVYVILDKSHLGINESLKVTLDAKNTRDIKNVEVVFLDPLGGLYSRNLKLVNGTDSYGTWSTTLEDFPSEGLYELYEIKITGSETEIFSDNKRSFYVISNSVHDSEELGLVYTSLSESEVNKSGNVTLTLDARDSRGVENVEALIVVTRSGRELFNFTISLSRILGEGKYGTWQGSIPITEGDATYELRTISLSNSEKSKEIKIEDRDVYATSEIPVTIITGSVIENFPYSSILKNPMLPFAVALIILAPIILFFNLKRWRTKNRNHN